MRNRHLSILLLLSLLATQTLALAHSVEHLFEDETVECMTCALAQQFKHTPPADAVLPNLPAVFERTHVTIPTHLPGHLTPAFQPRAPPAHPC